MFYREPGTERFISRLWKSVRIHLAQIIRHCSNSQGLGKQRCVNLERMQGAPEL